MIITRGIQIAIIDDGVNEGYYSLGEIYYNIEISSRLEVLERKGYDKFATSHGTTCAAIIKKYAPDAIISSIKVLNENLVGTIDKLIKAIYWCIDNKIKIINLSIGSVYAKDMLKLKEAINFAYAKGLIIIAACSNRNIITYPSSFSNVIGVSSDKRLNLAGNQYLYNINALNGIEIVAAGAHELTNFRGIKEVIVPANSYAAPLITALVYNILDKDQKLSMEQIKEQLAYSAIAENKETYSIVNRRINLDWVINSIIINLGMKDGILEEILYPFNVYEIINMTSTKLDTINKEIKAYSKLHKKALETIDTIIIIDNISITNSSIEQIFNCFSEKHIVYIPNNNTELQYNLAEVIDNSHKNIWYPYSITDIGLDRGINIEVPVILINNFGDINSLKLISQLRKRFENDGYEVTAISDMYLGCISSMYYVPSNGVNVDKLEPIIREINRLNNPDVLIVSINIGNELKGLNELLEPDVNILMKSDKDYLKNLIDLESRNNVIINDENGQEPVPSKHIAYFRSDEIDEIYEYLIRLYY